MTKFQTTLATAAIGLTAAIGGLFLIPNAADARECHYGDGYSICYEFVQRSGSLNGWLLDYQSNDDKEEINLVCDGKEVATWESNGTLSQGEVEVLTEAFCAL